jgi:hypothetical protein
LEKPWAIEVMPVLEPSDGLKFNCPKCDKRLGGGTWLVAVRIHQKHMCICVDPPPKCCGAQLTVPYAFTNQQEADALADEVELRMTRAGNTAGYILHDYLKPEEILRKQ